MLEQPVLSETTSNCRLEMICLFNN